MKQGMHAQRPQGDTAGEGSFFRDAALALAEIRWLYLAIALAMAVTLWYLVTVRDKVETWVDVKVEFKNTPSGLVIREGLISKISVRLRAAKGLSQSLTHRNFSVPVDLASLTPGSNALPITRDMLPFRGAYEILDINPPRVQIVADNLKTVAVGLETTFEGSLAEDFYIQSGHLMPKTVSVTGPESLVNSLTTIRVPVLLEKGMKKGTQEIRLDIPLPEGVSVEPAKVILQLELGMRMKSVRVIRDVQFDAAEGITAKLLPAKVAIEVDMPESQAHKVSALAAIAATVSVPAGNAKSGIVPVEVLLPDHAKLKRVLPDAISITLTPR